MTARSCIARAITCERGLLLKVSKKLDPEEEAGKLADAIQKNARKETNARSKA